MDKPVEFYKKRMKRIYVPYELFVIVLMIIHGLKGILKFSADWVWFVLGLQGTVVGILGGEHTWFISAILLCYLLTPIVSKLYEKSSLKGKWIEAVLLIIPIGLALIPPASVFTLGSLVCWYSLAYIYGRNYSGISYTRKTIYAVCGVTGVSLGLRLFMRALFAGTILYDRIAVGYTQAAVAFCIFIVISFVDTKRKPSRMITLLATISFEIYLYHFMFCVGPIRLFYITDSWVGNCVIVFIVSLNVGLTANRIGDFITKRILK